MPARPQAVAFDIIETVFSLEPVRAKLTALGVPPLGLDLLYAATLRDSFALAACNAFAPFATLLGEELDVLLATQGLAATAAQKQDVLAAMKELPAVEDARASFELLRAAGIRVFALSNGAQAATAGLLERAGLAELVEQVLSVDDVKLSKPRPEVYLYVARTAGLRPDAMALVATHPWDVQGAQKADLIGGYVARGKPFPSSLGRPDVSGDTLLDVARALSDL